MIYYFIFEIKLIFNETPQVLRLKECYKRSFKIKIDRLEVYESISDRCQQAEKKFIEVDAENKNLTAECQKSDETLAQVFHLKGPHYYYLLLHCYHRNHMNQLCYFCFLN